MSAFENSQLVKLVANDGTEITVDKGLLQLSSYVRGYLAENIGESEVPLPIINGPTLQKIVEYLQHYPSEPMKVLEKVRNEITRFIESFTNIVIFLLQPLASNDFTSLLQQPFYSSFIDQFTQEQLLEITRGANFMGISPLMDLCCAKIASFIRHRTPEEIRANLKLSNNFTKEQENKIREENKWADDL